MLKVSFNIPITINISSIEPVRALERLIEEKYHILRPRFFFGGKQLSINCLIGEISQTCFDLNLIMFANDIKVKMEFEEGDIFCELRFNSTIHDLKLEILRRMRIPYENQVLRSEKNVIIDKNVYIFQTSRVFRVRSNEPTARHDILQRKLQNYDIMMDSIDLQRGLQKSLVLFCSKKENAGLMKQRTEGK